MTKELQDEIADGKELCEKLVDHLLTIGATMMHVPMMRVRDDGTLIDCSVTCITAERKE